MKSFSKILNLVRPTNASFNSQAIQTQQLFGYAVQAVFSGSSINGSIKLQASADAAPDGQGQLSTPVNFTDIDGSSFTVTAAGSVFFNVSDVMYNWFRVVYTDASSGASNGTVTITADGKGA